MKLFKIEVHFKNSHRKRSGIDVLVHAPSKAAAKAHLAKNYTGAKVCELIDLAGPKHFVIADLVDEDFRRT